MLEQRVWRPFTLLMFLGAVLLMAVGIIVANQPTPSMSKVSPTSVAMMQALDATTRMPTPTVVVPRSTPTQTIDQAQVELLQTVTRKALSLRESAQRVDPQELAYDPWGHLGENVIVYGHVSNVTYDRDRDTTWLQLIPWTFWRPRLPISIAVRKQGKESGLLDAWVKISAIVGGTEIAERTLTGARSEVPLLLAYEIVVNPPTPRD